MPLAKTKTPTDRLNFYDTLTKKEIDWLKSHREVKVLQCNKPVSSGTWDLINHELLTVRPDLEIRIYGCGSSVCDLSFMTRIPNARHFCADCLIDATGLENIAAMEHLETLSVGIYHLESLDFLSLVPSSLAGLTIQRTKSSKPNLKYLSRFQDLRCLYIEGQQTNIKTISELKRLEKLTLRSVSFPNLDFIRGLSNLWSLDIKLGGIKDLSALERIDSIKYLELWQIRGLSDISVISTLRGLQYLYLQALRNVIELPDMSNLAKLRRVYLDTMKGLKNVRGLMKAPALEEFIHIAANNMEPAQYKPLLKLNTLKRARVGFGSDRKNNVFSQMMVQADVEQYEFEPFEYR